MLFRSDIYSLGITLYWLLNNRRMPFIGADEQITPARRSEAMEKRYAGKEKLPKPKNGSKRLKEIVLKACEYDPANRYASAQEMYDDLEALKTGNTQMGKTQKKNETVKPENHTETEKNGFEESGTIRGAVADDNWNESRETQGNSWGETTGTIGAPGGKKEKNKKVSGYQEEPVTETVGVKNPKPKAERHRTTAGAVYMAKEDNRNSKDDKPEDVDWLLSKIEVEKLTAKNVTVLIILAVVAGGIGIATLSIGIGVIGCGLAVYWLFFRIGSGDFDVWMEENKKKIEDIDEYIKTNPEFVKRLYYEKCPNKYLLEYVKKLNPDVVKEIKDSKK